MWSKFLRRLLNVAFAWFAIIQYPSAVERHGSFNLLSEELFVAYKYCVNEEKIYSCQKLAC